MIGLTPEMKEMVKKLKKPYPKRAASIVDDAPGDQLGEGGLIPTAALQLQDRIIPTMLNTSPE